MKRMCSSLLIPAAILSLVLFPTIARAMDPNEGLQWNQENKLRFELSDRFYFLSHETLQLKDKGHMANHIRDEVNVEAQYRLLENPLLVFGDKLPIPDALKLGKFECYGGLGLLTNEDAPDRLNVLTECGYTVQNRYRLEIGNYSAFNIGAKNFDKWGERLSWVGASVKLYDSEKITVDVYGKYFFSANVPAHLTSNDLLAADKKSELVAEFGSRVSYRPFKYLTLFAAAYGDVGDKKYSVESVGVSPGVRWDFGQQFLQNKGFLENMSVEVAGSYRHNLSGPSMSEEGAWLRFIWQLK